MYSILLLLHNFWRWLVLISLLFALSRACRGLLYNKSFSSFDNSVRHRTATIAHIQLVLGVWLYFISPLITYFFAHYTDAVHQRAIRFFGMEHSLMMVVAITFIMIGSAKAKRKKTDREKFKSMVLWFAIGLVIILISIPWPFSPFAARPYFRG